MIRVTAEVLKKLGACKEMSDRFNAAFPRGLGLSYSNLYRVYRGGNTSYLSGFISRLCIRGCTLAKAREQWSQLDDKMKGTDFVGYARMDYALLAHGLNAKGRKLLEDGK